MEPRKADPSARLLMALSARINDELTVILSATADRDVKAAALRIQAMNRTAQSWCDRKGFRAGRMSFECIADSVPYEG